MRCPHCGFEDPEEFVFCSECGNQRVAASPEMAPAGRAAGIEAAEWGRSAGRSGGLASGRGAPARLVGGEGPAEAQEIPLEQAEVTIGRRSECAIVVPDPSVSRHHASIRRISAGSYVIEDFESANGTWVNDARLQPHVPHNLCERDVIRLGKVAFTFRLPLPSTPSPAPSQTWIQDPGLDPSPFDVESEGRGSNAGAATPPRLSPPPREVVEVEWGPPIEPAHAPVVAAAAARGDSGATKLRTELASLRDDLAKLAERLTSLSRSTATIENQLAGGVSSGSPRLSSLAREVEAVVGLERAQAIQRVVSQARADPDNLKLLVRLSEELPAIELLLEFHLNALRELKGDD